MQFSHRKFIPRNTQTYFNAVSKTSLWPIFFILWAIPNVYFLILNVLPIP